jgi:uncharacterized membrane protein YdjX (TVP38/TMEM64 family)
MKRIAAAILLVIAMGLAWYLRGSSHFKPEEWIAFVRQQPVVAPFLFVLVYAAAVALFLPCLPLNVLAGVLWGPVEGSVVAIAGSFLGAIAAFLVARGALGQPLGRKFSGEYVSWLQDEFQNHGWKVVAFVRLNPIFPGPVNYLFGLTSIDFRTYCWASAVFLTPPTIAFAVLGDFMGSMALTGSIQNLRTTILLVGMSLLFLGGSVVVFRSRQGLRARRAAGK